MRRRAVRFDALMRAGALAAGLFALAMMTRPGPAHAYIEALFSFQEVLDQSTHVLVGTIVEIDRRNRTAVARIERPLKGGKEYDLVQMNLSVGPSIQAKYLLELWREDEPFVIYYQRHGYEIKSLAHSGDTWFQLFASHGDARRVWWRFTHIEIHFGRTYNGATDDLIRLTEDVLEKGRPAPPPDPSVPTIDVHKPPRRAGRSSPAGAVSAGPLIARGSTWRYFKGVREPSPGGDGSAWRGRGFDDSSWASGAAPFGYGDPPLGTSLGDMRQQEGKGGYATLYLRREVEIDDPQAVRDLALSVDYDDGFMLWINGKEAALANVPGGRPTHETLATGNHESGSYEPFRVERPADFLAKGKNVVAVQVFNRDLTSSDLKIDVELVARVEKRGSGKFRTITELPRPGGEVRGVSWVDVDGDDLLDVLFCRQEGNVLLMNDGDGFRDRTREMGIAGGSRAASWADHDGDDHPDLLTNAFELFVHAGGRLRLAGGAIDAPAARNPEGAGWIDYDGDGAPDALFTNGEHGILLYKSSGSGGGGGGSRRARFRDVSQAAGLGGSGLGKGNGDFVVFTDYDGDGYTDFFYNLGKGVLAHNEGDGTFALDERSGIELPGGSDYKRGVAFADFDNDGDVDLFVPAEGRPRLYRNENDGTFADVIDSAGDLAGVRRSFSAAWGDVDADGRLDIFVSSPSGASRLYLGDGRGRFQDATERLGLSGVGPSFGASFADADGDGDLDLAVNQESKVTVALNELERRDDHGVVLVRVRARRGVVGSVVRALDERGRPAGLRELNGAEGAGGQAAPVAHLALPRGEASISVYLSDGRVALRKIRVDGAKVVLTLRDEDFER